MEELICFARSLSEATDTSPCDDGFVIGGDGILDGAETPEFVFVGAASEDTTLNGATEVEFDLFVFVPSHERFFVSGAGVFMEMRIFFGTAVIVGDFGIEFNFSEGAIFVIEVDLDIEGGIAFPGEILSDIDDDAA